MDDSRLESHDAMSMGWVSLHRVLLDNPHFRDPVWVQIWVYLLLRATHTEQSVVFGGQRITLKPGQLITGRKAIAAHTGASESKVERVLKWMQKEDQIEQRTCNVCRLISITNWNKYQASGQGKDDRGTTDEQLPDTNNNEKNEEKENTLSEGDEAHLVLIRNPQLAGLSWPQDQGVRQMFGHVPGEIDWKEAARRTVIEVGLRSEAIRHPAKFWQRQIQAYLDECSKQKNRATLSGEDDINARILEAERRCGV